MTEGYTVRALNGCALRHVSCESCRSGESTCECVFEALAFARKQHTCEVRRGEVLVARVEPAIGIVDR